MFSVSLLTNIASTTGSTTCKYAKQIDFYPMDAKQAVGPVFARHLGQRMYRGEYFAARSDAHVDFVIDWDVSMIQQPKSAWNEMAFGTENVLRGVFHRSVRCAR